MSMAAMAAWRVGWWEDAAPSQVGARAWAHYMSSLQSGDVAVGRWHSAVLTPALLVTVDECRARRLCCVTLCYWRQADLLVTRCAVTGLSLLPHMPRAKQAARRRPEEVFPVHDIAIDTPKVCPSTKFALVCRLRTSRQYARNRHYDRRRWNVRVTPVRCGRRMPARQMPAPSVMMPFRAGGVRRQARDARCREWRPWWCQSKMSCFRYRCLRGNARQEK